MSPPCKSANGAAAGPVPARAPASTATASGGAAGSRVLVVDADRASCALLDEWLADAGCTVLHEAALPNPTDGRYELVIVDVPFPRLGGVDLIARVAHQYPDIPILALSSTFFSGIDSCGAVARSLGVACVLPKPASRERLIEAARRFLPVA